MRKFAISDIHGCAKTFRALVWNKMKLKPEDELYLLGDYVDRGPDSRGVIDFIYELQEKGYQTHCLRGNHEDMMLNALKSKKDLDIWIYNGGGSTLKSFMAEGVDRIPQHYLRFLRGLSYYFEVDDYLLVHAGLNFRKKNPLEIGQDMLWIRYWADRINYNWLAGRKIIHGHTPMEQERICKDASRIKELQFLNIDCGCYYSHRAGQGMLCAFELTTRNLYFQKNIEHR